MSLPDLAPLAVLVLKCRYRGVGAAGSSDVIAMLLR